MKLKFIRGTETPGQLIASSDHLFVYQVSTGNWKKWYDIVWWQVCDIVWWQVCDSWNITHIIIAIMNLSEWFYNNRLMTHRKLYDVWKHLCAKDENVKRMAFIQLIIHAMLLNNSNSENSILEHSFNNIWYHKSTLKVLLEIRRDQNIEKSKVMASIHHASFHFISSVI